MLGVQNPSAGLTRKSTGHSKKKKLPSATPSLSQQSQVTFAGFLEHTRRPLQVKHGNIVQRGLVAVFIINLSLSSFHSDLTISRVEELHLMEDTVEFFEKIGADGVYKCRHDPIYKVPHRKPNNGVLTEQQKDENNSFSADRVVVENVFSRLKQWGCMRNWRHAYDKQVIAAQFVFQLVQVAGDCMLQLHNLLIFFSAHR